MPEVDRQEKLEACFPQSGKVFGEENVSKRTAKHLNI
jgi:hypothetical protein